MKFVKQFELHHYMKCDLLNLDLIWLVEALEGETEIER